MLVFLAAGSLISLYFATAIFGRVWCGWACPQTVFVDAIFRRIERFVEGEGSARRARDAGPWTMEKASRRAVKWGLFLAATLAITLTFVSYFVGTDSLPAVIRSWPGENRASFIVLLVSSTVVLFDFGWFREQFCTIVCPYGRFQSVLMDDHSMIVGYDASRGEPRAGAESGTQAAGDCVNCYRCVQVCPTGIDIRRGVQLECIACTACVDACDEVMERLKKPAGLIRYTSLDQLSGKAWRHLSPRSVAYSLALIAYVSGLAYRLHSRKDLFYEFVRYVGTPYTMNASSKGGRTEVVNHYKIDFSNQGADNLEIRLVAPPEDRRGFEYVTQMVPLAIGAGTAVRTDLFVSFPKELLEHGKTRSEIEIVSLDTKTGVESTQREPLALIGPY
jgi:cytochrome c oxidase accessory protein FixG